MGLGIIDPDGPDSVPGTSALYEAATSGAKKLILLPHPSNSPNDPLVCILGMYVATPRGSTGRAFRLRFN